MSENEIEIEDRATRCIKMLLKSLLLSVIIRNIEKR